MKTKVLTFLYFLTGILFMFLQNLPDIFPGFIAKALIIPLLMLLLALNLNPADERSNRLMLAALFFSWAGDVILEFSHLNGSMFIPGLLSFLLAHVMFIFVFIRTPGKKGFLVKHIYLLVPVILYGIGLVFYLYNDLAGMRIPVIIYAAVILTMLSASFDRLEKVNRASYWLVVSGAILFVISDSAIAVNKFSGHFAGSGIIIMSTYIIAQYLIVTGYLRQFRKEQNPV